MTIKIQIDKGSLFNTAVISIFALLIMTGLLYLYGTMWYELPLWLTFILADILVSKWFSCINLPCLAVYPVLAYVFGKTAGISILYFAFSVGVLFLTTYAEIKLEDKDEA